MVFSWAALKTELSVLCRHGQFTGKLHQHTTEEWTALYSDLQGEGSVYKVIVSLKEEQLKKVLEAFPCSPNVEDVQMMHPDQTISLGILEEHPDYHFGKQWFFTPPPLVFPLRMEQGWIGIAVGAEPGRNLFTTVSLKAAGTGEYEVHVYYDGYYKEEGKACTVFLTNEYHASPNEVIASYSRLLQELKWAPAPKRSIPDWWKETFLCTWGDQFNITKINQSKPNKETETHHITTYETQANQTKWFKTLQDYGIPVGIISTSDKWQLDRYRPVPDEDRYEDLRAFVDWHHREGRKVIAWWGLWHIDGAPAEWSIRDENGKPLTLDPEHPELRKVMKEDIKQLISPDGFDMDGFFIDFTGRHPNGENCKKYGDKWGMELLYDYVKCIHDNAKSAKSDAMIMTHCCHPYFADVTDVFRLNDFLSKAPNSVQQGEYRYNIAAMTSDWLINMDNWWMYDLEQWRKYQKYAPTKGIPAAWHTQGVFGMGADSYGYEPFTEEDYIEWRDLWMEYRKKAGLS
ncbi:alpha-amylase family protein [Salibacterium aidingense]|uniref:hypothetical protein n=1 Tax=Salibacterium aidingense TaxID=384933 RepID=UPI0003FD2F9F|nr:hypothetical protein [Salibacterium aidingense]